MWRAVVTGADYKFVGEKSQDYAGRMVADAGDVDGDSLDDVLGERPTTETLDRAQPISSWPRIWARSRPWILRRGLQVRGHKVNDYAGISLSGAGDAPATDSRTF